MFASEIHLGMNYDLNLLTACILSKFGITTLKLF
jgi:hypothetical protein